MKNITILPADTYTVVNKTVLNESDKSLDNKYCGYYQEGKNKKGKNFKK